ncbi:MAG: ABC transporter ATP-binding protein [Acidimicrobiia bacterium]|nr:ABC transporter ATP-binding protein [Acidimicrobiia bacterium]
MTDFAVEIRNLSKRYRKVRAVDGLSFDVEAGSICGFLGPNGAGKSTTMRILMGLTRPTGGHAFVLGHDVASAGLSARARIGYLPQDPVFPAHLSVRGLVTYAARLHPGHPTGRSLRRRVDDMLDRVGLADRSRRRVQGLSGGERQRVGIAQALISDPALVILDEPSAGLDPVGRRAMIDLIAGVGGDATVFYSTHILDDVERVSDSVVMINHGSVVAHGPLSSILEAKGMDYVVGLRGDTSDLHTRVTAQPWVSGLISRNRGSVEEWRIQVSDVEAAARDLMSILVAGTGHSVIEFHTSDRRLEDAYLELVGAGNDN